MARYADGSPAKIGDVVTGRDAGRDGRVVGQVVLADKTSIDVDVVYLIGADADGARTTVRIPGGLVDHYVAAEFSLVL